MPVSPQEMPQLMSLLLPRSDRPLPLPLPRIPAIHRFPVRVPLPAALRTLRPNIY